MEIRCDRLTFARAGRRVIDALSCTIRGPGLTLVTGVNGSGKSTFLRLLAGLERADSGRITVDGEPIGAATRRRLAFAFQDAVFLDRSVRDNLELALGLRGIARRQRQERIDAVIDLMQIRELIDRPARALSGGEAQLVNLARVLALRAEVVLLDEPSSGFDRERSGSFQAQLPHLLRAVDSTVILVTHDPELIAAARGLPAFAGQHVMVDGGFEGTSGDPSLAT
jgi:ABC-type multidrug transport system ATPase subunit